jgi:hypothetical protein
MGLESRDGTVFLARVGDFVNGQLFPAKKANLIARARRANTPSDIYALLLNLPDRTYDSEADLRRATGELAASTRT